MKEKKTNISGMGKNRLMISVIIILAVLFLLGASMAGYFYKQLSDIKKDPNKTAQDELNATLTAVGKLITLPTGEQLTLATVTDPEKLNDQPFFTKAKTGDKVLIYGNAGKAILYRPSENRLIEVAPLSSNSQSENKGN